MLALCKAKVINHYHKTQKVIARICLFYQETISELALDPDHLARILPKLGRHQLRTHAMEGGEREIMNRKEGTGLR